MATTRAYELSITYGATPSSTVVVPAEEPAEFERFEALAAGLLKVPKADVDEKRKQDA